jgi:hypothetical protein
MFFLVITSPRGMCWSPTSAMSCHVSKEHTLADARFGTELPQYI